MQQQINKDTKKSVHAVAGPSASLTFSWGNCTFNETQFLDSSEDTKIFNCTEPSIVYDKEPAIFTSKYKSGDSFTGKVHEFSLKSTRTAINLCIQITTDHPVHSWCNNVFHCT